MTSPQNTTTVVHYVTYSRVMLVIAAVCFFLAAITECGSNVLNAPALAWAFGAFSAWCLAGVVL